MNMAGFTAKEIERAREMDLLTYLRQNDPGNLIHISGGEYCTREHDSLKISNGKWMWWSRGFGGVSALDYLIKVKDVPFTEAVGMILDTEAEQPPFSFVPKRRQSKAAAPAGEGTGQSCGSSLSYRPGHRPGNSRKMHR
jgi:hypothetical protein